MPESETKFFHQRLPDQPSGIAVEQSPSNNYRAVRGEL
jgi:hypothetical protein